MTKLNNQAFIEQLPVLLKFERTWLFNVLKYMPHGIVSLFTGNRFGKTAVIAFLYVLRLLGWHPVPFRNVLYFECENISDRDKHPMMKVNLPDGSKIPFARRGQFMDSFLYHPIFMPPKGVKRPEDNICPFCKGKVRIKERSTRVIRFGSAKLPTDKAVIAGGQSSELSNAQYPELKKWLPPALIKKDITARNPSVTIFDINSNIVFGDQVYEGGDIIIEFIGYHQDVVDTAGVPRLSFWPDEHCPYDLFDESYQRLYEEDGDVIMTLTPAMGMNWERDEIAEVASLYVRTEAVCEANLKYFGTPLKQIEHTDNDTDIVMFQAATDDNPTLDAEVIEKRYKNRPDIDDTGILTRRFGFFKGATGTIFKDMNYKVHLIDPKKYLIGPETISSWRLGRSFDFHPKNPHAIVWVGISREDELFVYQEWDPMPEKWVLKRLCRRIAEKSGDYKFSHNLIDPLANQKNQDHDGTKKTSVEIMNKHFYSLKRDGIGTGGHWKAYNTKGEVGRDAIIERLANSLKVKTPFNNKVVENGREIRLPTIWIFQECRQTAQSLKKWSTEQWAATRQLVSKDKKESPAQKWSHFCTALEGLLKEKGFKGGTGKGGFKRRDYNRFKGGRR